MSEKKARFENPFSTHRKPDPRAMRTRHRLGTALVQLMLIKSFDDITVQEVLDCAQVSRSTFYAHYRDKTDLFSSEVDEFYQSISTLLKRDSERSERVAPVAELFTHVAAAHELFAVLVASGKIHEVRELGEAHFARSIPERLPGRGKGSELRTVAGASLAHALAGSLFSLLLWWLRQGRKTSALEMDRLFHRMVANLSPLA